MIKTSDRDMADSLASDIRPGIVNHREDIAGLVATLAELIDRLTKPPEDGDKTTGMSDAMWKDDTYCYIELSLDRLITTEVDLNLTNGRVFLRVAR